MELRSIWRLIAVLAIAITGCASTSPEVSTAPFNEAEDDVADVEEIPEAAPSTSAPALDADVDETQTPPSGELPDGAVLCEDIAPPPGSGALDPTGTPAEFSTARELLIERMGDSLVGIGAGGTSSHVGRITLGLNTRGRDVLQLALDTVEPRLFCFELPPPEFDDEAPVPAVWTLDGTPGADAMSITLLVDDPSPECGHDPRGRILPAVVDETNSEVRITIELEPLPWGAYNCAGWSPVPLEVELSQPLGDRVVTGSPDIAPPPPVVPTPREDNAALFTATCELLQTPLRGYVPADPFPSPPAVAQTLFEVMQAGEGTSDEVLEVVGWFFELDDEGFSPVIFEDLQTVAAARLAQSVPGARFEQDVSPNTDATELRDAQFRLGEDYPRCLERG